jgi:hypothetical protein
LDRAVAARLCRFPSWRRRLDGSGVLGAPFGVGGGRRSELGLPGRYVHRRRHFFMVDASFDLVQPCRSLAIPGHFWVGGALACASMKLELASQSSLLRS